MSTIETLYLQSRFLLAGLWLMLSVKLSKPFA